MSGDRQRQRQRDRDRETERQRDRDRETETDRETDTETERDRAERQRQRQTEGHRGGRHKQTDRQTEAVRKEKELQCWVQVNKMLKKLEKQLPGGRCLLFQHPLGFDDENMMMGWCWLDGDDFVLFLFFFPFFLFFSLFFLFFLFLFKGNFSHFTWTPDSTYSFRNEIVDDLMMIWRRSGRLIFDDYGMRKWFYLSCSAHTSIFVIW